MQISQYIPKRVSLDDAQISLIQILEEIKNNILRPKLLKLIKEDNYKGVYIYGAVGRGKTVIIQAFFDSLKGKKIFYHYQAFIKYLHEESHRMFLSKEKDPVLKLARNLAKIAKFIFIDELEVRDITDAMLLQRLCAALAEHKVFLVFTSNIEPGDLYKEGLQRELFMKFINFVNKKFFVHHLNSQKDYRFSKIAANKNIILSGFTKENLELFEEMVSALTHNGQFSSDKIVVFGRVVEFEKSYQGVLCSNYTELFSRELSYNDYLSISQKYNAIILDRIPQLKEGSDVIIRFINFIDNIYTNKVMLIGLLEVEPSKLYLDNKYKKEFQRAISRINEMNSQEYIKLSKYYRHNNE